MSHTMTIQTRLRRGAELDEVLRRLELEAVEGRHKLYAGEEEGLGIRLSGWRYPAVLRADGSLACDTYGGAWGAIERLHEVEAAWGAEVARGDARRRGWATSEEETDEEILLTVEVGE